MGGGIKKMVSVPGRLGTAECTCNTLLSVKLRSRLSTNQMISRIPVRQIYPMDALRLISSSTRMTATAEHGAPMDPVSHPQRSTRMPGFLESVRDYYERSGDA